MKTLIVKKWIFCLQMLLIISLSNLYISNAYAIGAELVYDMQDVTQTTISASNSVQILQNQINDMLNYDGSALKWSDVSALLLKLSNTVSQGNALAYNAQNINDAFKAKFPGYKSQTDYDTAYQQWSSTLMDTLRNTLESAGLQANAFTDEQSTLNTLKTLSTTAQGRMQAIQVGNMIATEQVGQMQKLRQLIVSQTNAQNVYMASQVQQAQAQQASAHELLSNPLPYPKYGTGQGFGEMPQINN